MTSKVKITIMNRASTVAPYTHQEIKNICRQFLAKYYPTKIIQLTVVLTTPIQQLIRNQQDRKQNYIATILTYPQLAPDLNINVMIADILLCLWQIKQTTSKQQISYQAYFKQCCQHGIKNMQQ